MDSTNDLDKLYDELLRQKSSGKLSETLCDTVLTAIRTNLAKYDVTINRAVTMDDEFTISIDPPKTLFPNLRKSWAIDAGPTRIRYRRFGTPDKPFDEYLYAMVTTCKQVLDRLNFLDFLDRNFQELSPLGYIVDTVDFNYAINGSNGIHTSLATITDLHVLKEEGFRSIVIFDNYQEFEEFIASVKLRDFSVVLAKRRKIYGECDVQVSFKKTVTDGVYCIIAEVYRRDGILEAKYNYRIDAEVITKLDYISRKNNPEIFSEYFPNNDATIH